MSTTKFEIIVQVEALHPDGVKLTTSEIRSRIRRLLDEYESARSQPADFYLTNPVITLGSIKVIHS